MRAKIQNANSANLLMIVNEEWLAHWLMELQSRQVLKTLRAEPTETSPSFCIRDRVTPCISTGWMPTVWVATLLGRTWGTANEHQVEPESTVWSHHIKAKLTVLLKCGSRLKEGAMPFYLVLLSQIWNTTSRFGSFSSTEMLRNWKGLAERYWELRALEHGTSQKRPREIT